MSGKVVLCDVDEVCADMLPEFLRRYNERWNDTLTLEDISNWDVSKIVKSECGELAHDIFAEPDLYDYVKPIHGALEGIEALRYHGLRVVFLTSCPVGSANGKVKWLIQHGFVKPARTQRDIIIASDKALVRGDILIDDGLHNILSFNPGRTILFDQPHNHSVNWPVRARNWREVVCLTLDALLPNPCHESDS